MANWVGCDTPSPCSERFPLGEHANLRSGGAIPPPPQKGYLSDTGAIPSENKANGCETPLCNSISKRGEAFLLTVGAFLLAVKLLCLQSLKALIRSTFPL